MVENPIQLWVETYLWIIHKCHGQKLGEVPNKKMVIPRYNQDWLIYVKYYWNPIYGDHSPYESIRPLAIALAT